ncbi:MAG: cation diffusion facilitator family transporter [Desulfobacterales bacterium]
MTRNTIHQNAGRRVTVAGLAVNSLLILLKAAAGVFGDSRALIADAVHSVSDLFTDVVVLLGLQMGGKPPDSEHHFGHGRIETMASAGVGLVLLATGAFIGVEAITDIYEKQIRHPTITAIAGAAVSIVLKEAMYRYTVYIGKRLGNQLIIANAWHHRTDSLSSIAVLIGVTGAIVNPSWYFLDSVAALVVAFFIAKIAVEIITSTFREITDTAPPEEIVDKIKACSLSVNGVLDVHDLRVRSLAGHLQMEIHVVVDGRMSVSRGHDIAKTVETCIIRDVRQVDKVLVHVDPKDD